ncbi:potassium transporter [Myriangium duriaei CBS 260.36]|uniref:Potassium transporter n=1 Tax=Myriangium duriaei CBS 260.36 TaxID=1168546 RepID=A0A9P4MRR5_9PEZI|nr:potassium transporter [Myriangium duriaei CBS 260.36]
MTSIRIAEGPAHPRRTEFTDDTNIGAREHSIYQHKTLERSRTTLAEDGIVNLRSRGRSRSRTNSSFLERRFSLSSKETNEEDDDPGLGRPDDFKHKQEFKGRYLIWLAYQSVGVIYGDVGTSPLYVYSSVFTSPPSKQNLVGILSVIIWSLSIMVTLKYVLCILYADNDGEGGSFSTYSLLSRYLNITHRDPREKTMVQMKRIKSGDLEIAGRTIRRGLEHSKFFKRFLKVVGIVAVTAVIADGVLTPAQSVLGAVQGIEVVKPDISKSTVLGVTNAILVFMFAIQPLGIARMTFAFSPIIIIWLGFNASFGIYNLVKYDATVFKAFNPGFAFEFLIRNGHEGWKMLGGVLLAFTGVEALFADLGAFSRGAIQLSWLTYTYPCLLLAYIGQAAYISEHPAAYSNPFFNAAPPGTLYPSLVMAILAAIVASQAIITATFQLLSQVMKLSYFPQLKVVHTSDTFHGQLYVPLANWLLMIGTILVASIYNNTTSLGNAYGVCVMLVTFFDTSMVALAAMFVWGYRPYLVFLPWLIIACHDATYLSAALVKVPSGGWFTLSLAALLAIIFLTWRYGKEQQWAVEAEDRFPTSHFIHKKQDGSMRLTERYSGTSLSSSRGLGIFFDKAGETTPTVFSQFAIKLTAMPEAMVFFHLRPLERPSVPAEERYSVSRLAIPHCYRLVCRHGYNDTVMTADLGAIIYEQVRDFIAAQQHRQQQQQADNENAIDDDDDDDTPDPAVPRRSGEVHRPSADNEKDIDADSASQATLPPGSDAAAQQQAKSLSSSSDERIPRISAEAELTRLDAAFAHKVLYIVGKESLKIKSNTGYIRGAFLWVFLWMRENTRGKIADLRLPGDSVVEVGFLKEI